MWIAVVGKQREFELPFLSNSYKQPKMKHGKMGTIFVGYDDFRILSEKISLPCVEDQEGNEPPKFVCSFHLFISFHFIRRLV